MVDGARSLTHKSPEAPVEQTGLLGRDIYMIGIGGCGMSGLARMLRTRGALVRGGDHSDSVFTRALAESSFAIGTDEESVPETCDLVIASAAVKPDHLQIIDAVSRGLRVLTYAEALGQCMNGTTGIAIAGTHGKSTTSAILACALSDAGLDPTVIVGAHCPQLGGGFRLGSRTIPSGIRSGQPGLLIVEACEYNRSFHNYHPKIAAITSVEADHLDIYGSIDAVVEAFRGFAEGIAPAADGGVLLIAHDGAHRRDIASGLACAVETIGYSPDADWIVQHDPTNGLTTLTRRESQMRISWRTPLPGSHNAMNAATALALAWLVGADAERTADAISKFAGLKRRTEFLGERTIAGGVVRVWDDYGHHPTEVEVTLRALREHEQLTPKNGRLICVFQPHQHSRTRFLLDEFASAFNEADVVIVPEIYFVRDSQAEKARVSSADLVDRLRSQGVAAMHLYPFGAIAEQLEVICRPGDTLVVMGAGPVNCVANQFLGLDA